MVKKIKISKYYLIMCIICFLPRIMFALQSVPFRTRGDEFGTLAATAYLAGLDWSDLSGRIPYYGFGATMLFVPLFWIINNPIIIYKIMIGVWGILQGSVGCIAWHLGKKYFKLKDEKILMFTSSIASYAVVTRNTAIFNETPMILVMWLLCWILLSLNVNVNNAKKKILSTFLLCALLIYSLTLHTRAIMFILAIIVVGIAYFIVRKKMLYSLSVFGVIGIGGFLFIQKFISFIQNAVLLMDERVYVANTSIGVGGVSLLTHVENWQSWLNIVIGQINTLSLISGTVIIVAILWIIRQAFAMFFNKEEITTEKLSYLCIVGFALVCVIGTILGQSISEWLEYAVDATKIGMNSQAYGVKGFTYIRYAGPYVGVVIWAFFVKCINNCSDIEKVRGYSILVTAFIHIYWLACIVPYIYQNSVTNEAYLPFAFINNFEYSTRLRTYLIGTVVILIMMLILWLFLHLKQKKILLLVYLVFLMHQFCYNGFFQDIYLMKDSYKEVEDTCNLVRILDEKGLIADIIGVYDAKNTSHQTNYVYQFCFFQKKVISAKDAESIIGDTNIIITNTEEAFNDYILRGYQGACVDQEETSFIVTKNMVIIEELVEAGYNVQ